GPAGPSRRRRERATGEGCQARTSPGRRADADFARNERRGLPRTCLQEACPLCLTGRLVSIIPSLIRVNIGTTWRSPQSKAEVGRAVCERPLNPGAAPALSAAWAPPIWHR